MDFVGNSPSVPALVEASSLIFLQWSRLIGGAGSSPKKPKQPNANIPQQRLARFKATYNSLLVFVSPAGLILGPDSPVANMAQRGRGVHGCLRGGERPSLPPPSG